MRQAQSEGGSEFLTTRKVIRIGGAMAWRAGKLAQKVMAMARNTALAAHRSGEGGNCGMNEWMDEKSYVGGKRRYLEDGIGTWQARGVQLDDSFPLSEGDEIVTWTWNRPHLDVFCPSLSVAPGA